MSLTAYTLALAWALFWVWFGLTSGISEGIGPSGVLVHALMPGVIFLALALSAFYSEGIGGMLLLSTGALFAVLYPLVFPSASLSVKVFCELALAAPPVIAGVLLLKHIRWMHKLLPGTKG